MPAAVGAGLGLIALKITGSAVAQQVVSFVGSGVAAFIFSRVFGKKKKRDNSREIDPAISKSDYTQRAELQFERIILGEVKSAGVLTFGDVSNIGTELPSDTPEPDTSGAYRIEQTAFANHICDSYYGIEVGGTIASLDASGFATHPRFVVEGVPYLALSFSNTRFAVVDPIMKRNFPQIENTYRQPECLVATAEYFYGRNSEEHSKVWQDGLDIRMFIRGAKVFDPRDITQHYNNPSTWKWTDNAALVTAHLLTNPTFNAGVHYTDIDMDVLRHSANVCDRGMVTADGSIEKQYGVSGIIDTSESQGSVIEDCLLAMNGTIRRKGELIQIIAGEPKENPDWVIDDSMLFGEIESSRGTPPSEHYTKVSARCIVPEADWRISTVPTVDIGGASPNNQLNITYRFVNSVSRAQRLARAQLIDAMQERDCVLTVGRIGLHFGASDIVKVVSNKMPHLTGLYSVLEVTPNSDGSQSEVVLKGYSNEMYEWKREYALPYDPTLNPDI